MLIYSYINFKTTFTKWKLDMQEIIKLYTGRKTPLHYVLKSTTTHTYQDDLYIKQWCPL